MFKAAGEFSQNIGNAFQLFGTTLQAAAKYPVFIFPLILVWCIYAPSVIYLHFHHDWDNTNGWVNFAVIFGSFVALSVLISSACFILLEQIRLIETGHRPTIISSISVAAGNVIRALPVTMLWAVLWFIISVIEVMLRRKNETSDKEASPENIARTLAGEGTYSLSSAFMDMLSKGVRMLAFLIFPAIAWEKHDRPMRRGIEVARAHRTEFAAGFALTEVAAAIVFLPPALVFWASSEGVAISDNAWFATIIYIGFAWSLMLLLEQLFTAELYLWDMKWRDACEAAARQGLPKPSMQDVPKPSIIDGNADLVARY
ncbi:MAG: DUF2463 domain-containing protein [Aquisalinus sp.]|nr:DUF2463 domain-containing protein [Aquisalinus sp.]